MKILRLRFKNIHSLKGENVIDFTKMPLVDTGIFAIIGATGSGKSTILDVISLALFNRTPRMGAISKSAVENYGSIVTRNTDECYCEVEYEVNTRQYRSKWSISRARTGNFRDYNMELSSLPDNQFLDVKRSKVPDKNIEIIGLNYDQFVKSILLSQGEFARFLKADANERGELLEKITGTEIYRNIGKAAFERHKAEQQKLDNLIAIKDTYKLLEENEINELTQREKELIQETGDIKKQLETVGKLREIKERLQKLEKESNRLQEDSRKLQQQKKDFEKQTLRLKQHEKVLPLISDIKEVENIQSQIEQLTKKNKDLLDAIELLNKKQDSLQQSLAKFKVEKDTLEKEYEKLKPVLKKVRELDKEIGVVHSRIKDRNETIEQKKSNINKNKNRREQLEKQIEIELKQQKEHEKWLNENSILQSVSKEIGLIEDIIKKYKKNEASALQAIKEPQKNKLVKIIAKAEKWEEKARLINESISTNSQKAEALAKKLEYDWEDMPKLNKETEHLKQARTDVEKQLNIADEYMETDKKKSVLLKEQEKNTEQAEKNEVEKNKLLHEIEIADKHIEELKSRNERQQLEAKYSDDRKKLQAGEPCYLCGATTHPYVKQHTDHSNQTKKQLREKEQQLKKLRDAVLQCEKQESKLQSDLTSNKKQLDEIENRIQKLNYDFKQINAVYETNFSISNSWEINTFYAQQKDDLTYKTGQKQKLEQYVEAKNNLQQLKYLEEKTRDVLESRETLKGYYQKYKKYIANVRDSQQIVPKLTKVVEQYEGTSKALITTEESIRANQKQTEEFENTIGELTSELEESEKQNNEEKGKLNELRNNREELLDTRTPENAEEESAKKRNAKQNEITTTEKKLAGLHTEIKSKEQQVEENEESITVLKQRASELQTQLHPKINGLGYQNRQQVLGDLLEEDEVQKIAERVEKMQKKEVELKQSLADKKNEIEQNRQNDDKRFSLEEILTKQESYVKKQETYHREIGVIQTKLSENEENAKAFEKHTEEVVKQEKETTRWKNLKNLIGDAEGKNFAKFAQELTLIQLIALANKHLETLNDRYVIQKGDNKLKEELIVIDTYQGNAERSVKTLSGGESFLMSLALALALSDLAGKNTKIDSLFIDEGFGSLDQETLDIALNALEKLQTESKRTIGIISHVETLKERITTHIALKKGNAGFSTIEIR